MKRRGLLLTFPLLIGVSGCIDGNGPQTMSEGTTIVAVTVEEGFSGYVVLDVSTAVGLVPNVPSPQAETISMQSGESVRITREDNSEQGNIRIVINRDEVYSTAITEYESYELRVTEDGEIEEEIIVA